MADVMWGIHSTLLQEPVWKAESENKDLVRMPFASSCRTCCKSHSQAPRMASIALIGTCDTKLEELLSLRQKVLDAGAGSVTLLDVGRSPTHHPAISASQPQIAACHPKSSTTSPASLPRGHGIQYMRDAAVAFLKLHSEYRKYDGIVSAGGSGGTSLVTAVMRQVFPIGLPKLMVSTVASGDTGPFVEETDITMMYSVVDIAGTNSLLDVIFENAAGSIVGMANACKRRKASPQAIRARDRPKRVGMTMFGVTTPCIDQARAILTSPPHNLEVFVFHATGHGGKAMERLVQEGQLDAVLDVTTTEICDLLCGGNMAAGPERLEAALSAGIPCIISTGATDMINFGPKATLPEKYHGRNIYEHNPTVTIVRTNEDECAQVGRFIADKINRFSKRPENVKIMFPLKGVSVLSTPGGQYEDLAADEALRRSLVSTLQQESVSTRDIDAAVNDHIFSQVLCEELIRMVAAQRDESLP